MIIDSRNILDKMIMLIAGWWLSPIPLNNMSLSVGMMKFHEIPKIWKNVPNHQPVN
jgi:hypothetical protein